MFNLLKRKNTLKEFISGKDDKGMIFNVLGEKISEHPLVIYYDVDSRQVFYLKMRSKKSNELKSRNAFDWEEEIKINGTSKFSFIKHTSYVDCAQIFVMSEDDFQKLHPDNDYLDLNSLGFQTSKKILDKVISNLNHTPPKVSITEVSVKEENNELKTVPNILYCWETLENIESVAATKNIDNEKDIKTKTKLMKQYITAIDKINFINKNKNFVSVEMVSASLREAQKYLNEDIDLYKTEKNKNFVFDALENKIKDTTLPYIRTAIYIRNYRSQNKQKDDIYDVMKYIKKHMYNEKKNALRVDIDKAEEKWMEYISSSERDEIVSTFYKTNQIKLPDCFNKPEFLKQQKKQVQELKVQQYCAEQRKTEAENKIDVNLFDEEYLDETNQTITSQTKKSTSIM
ncbi:hypothetical protein H9M94_01115 [Mycoplasma sp. Pen4]|uniref:Mbov_0400 family ICE element protein n=1 Tax=Mycoplasma sp. Pen4 TaxID=640330 RepID=UPI0016544C83|nr:hypothetical protein [Mycoplasma sp. Pen4]QNM93763.1 hypothetical protein H9M94_00600 [Mycoplasma sp. Pen4]QNM93859.1 hypothetical protein H9M94_01115 [Mycoplasma sp. Pen4]